jgi:hypothetical protein
VKKLEEYERHAAECRDMARTAQPTHRVQLEKMAEAWDAMALARKRELAKLGKDRESED